MIKTLRVVVAAAAAMCVLSAQAATPAPKAGTISLGDGNSVKATNGTEFLGTQYDPTKCVLQFASLQCTLGSKTDCGDLNGYKLECVNLGKENGKDKLQCACAANETDVCQNSTNPVVGGVPQFGDCSGGKTCADAYGHVPSKVEGRICAEKLHCVKEINTTASVKAEICHTCRSCIAQNDDQNNQLTDKKRFDCTSICPKEILDSIAKRNKQNVGIADEVSSGSDSASGSGSSSTSEDLNATAAPAATTKKPSSNSPPSLSAATIVGTLVASTLSVAFLL